MPKRKSSHVDGTAQEVAPRRSTRQRTSTTLAAQDGSVPSTTPNSVTKGVSKPARSKPEPAKTKSKATKGGEDDNRKVTTALTDGDMPKVKETPANSKSLQKADGVAERSGSTSASGRQYWLLKAEPESRLENGVDVKFSIDDLAAKTEPEPWDGIRNYVARNNLRAMKKGDLAFFYHSNTKEPGIVGTMEIVQEHSPDLSAHDPKAPYYDPKSSPSDPKWSVVHVKFRSKFAVPIGLKRLREMGGSGKPLENMQMLRQSRLSVSKVSEEEWGYLMGVAEEEVMAAK
ncbi:Thymocyte nuclear protein 1 [Cytospora mali]|uniref:Thymocyte nuclear protein 1 n=1 Tax=Cytospora mali TaxID=578113 RepID=A0A194V8C8_CYTMA|nr:Thymocyte nuclear protein 1 [Valsa mali var. pyri (nom. inval.)]